MCFLQDVWYIFTVSQPYSLTYENSLLHLLYLQNMWFLYDACCICSETTDAAWLRDMVCCIFLQYEDPTSCSFAATYAFIIRFPFQGGTVSMAIIAL